MNNFNDAGEECIGTMPAEPFYFRKKKVFVRVGKKQKVKVLVEDRFKIGSVMFVVHESLGTQTHYSVSEYKSGTLFYSGARTVEDAGKEAVKKVLTEYSDDNALLSSVALTCKKMGVANKAVWRD